MILFLLFSGYSLPNILSITQLVSVALSPSQEQTDLPNK